MITSSGSRNDVTRSVKGIPNHLSSTSISSYQIIFEKKQRGHQLAKYSKFVELKLQLCKKGTALI